MKDSFFAFTDIFEFDVSKYTCFMRFEPGEDILKEGDQPLYLYYLINGRAKLYLTHENGKATLINFLSAPCFIGEMELLDEKKRSDGVRAVSVCECYAVKVSECREKLLHDTKFLRYLCEFLSRKAVGNTSNYSRNQSYTLKSRLASFILETSVNGMYREQHTEVAEYLGVTYRHLLYVLAEFVKEGVLERTRSGYKIIDLERLRDIDNHTVGKN
ncbi:MAG: transcriptional regulator YeiL [Lachnospiraceae bacterium]|nr:transcriptional regulator YeiL [Lachnospiraceae bacterium]